MSKRSGTVLIAVIIGAAALLATDVGKASAVDMDRMEMDRMWGSYGAHVGWTQTRGADDGNYLLGGHLEVFATPWLGLIGAVEYRSEETIAPAATVRDFRTEVRTVPVTLSTRLYLPTPAGFMPFLTGGAGWYRQSFQVTPTVGGPRTTHRESNFGWHLGAGARVRVAPNVSFFGEGRTVFLDPDRDLDEDIRDDIRDVNFNSTYFSGGLSLHF